jgi:hypothetical protein
MWLGRKYQSFAELWTLVAEYRGELLTLSIH